MIGSNRVECRRREAPAASLPLELWGRIFELLWIKTDGSRVTEEGAQHTSSVRLVCKAFAQEAAAAAVCLRPAAMKDTDKWHAHFPNLQVLSLCRIKDRPCTVTDVELLPLLTLTGLTSLNIDGCAHVTDNGLQHLQSLTNLRSLSLNYCHRITCKGLQHLQQLVYLTDLSLDWCGELGNSSMEALKPLTSLRHLSLSECKLTDRTVGTLQHLSSLSTLDISRNWMITDAGLKPLANLKALAWLDLTCCYELTRQGADVLRNSIGAIIVPYTANRMTF